MILLFLATFIVQTLAQLSEPSCDSKIYCQGPLLDTIQMVRPFNDSKSFVDMKMINNENTTLENFDQFMTITDNTPTRDEILQFMNENFEPGNELEDWIPSDYNENPEILSRITDEDFRNFATDLVKVWPTLAKKIKQEVIDNPGLYSILPVHEGFIIPGGRFKEFYYWDSYWIVKGLLLCDMHDTVKGMLNNFLEIVNQYGRLPNGARQYYLNRSQPPLLTLMAALYFQETQDIDWLETNVETLDQELRFWLNNNLVTVTKEGVDYILAHYNVPSGSPRPESYYEDVTTASVFSDQSRKEELYADLKSGAESGFDFSSRWIVDENGGIDGNLSNLHTRRIIPVDLNSFLCSAFRRISEFYITLNRFDDSDFWSTKSTDWQQSIEKVFYNGEDGIWYDWDNELNQQRKFFFASNFAPLWAEAFDPMFAESLGELAADYLVKQNIMDFQGGIPTSLSNTGEQWDLPNAWPPLQSIVIIGLDNTGNCKAKESAKELARRWVVANRIGFNETAEMFEKYDAITPGQYGGGGEYTVQSGFGWTNGVVFEFIDKFFTTEAKKKFR